MKRIPYRRGKGNSKMSVKPIVIRSEDLLKLQVKGPIDAKALVEAGLIKPDEVKRSLKILGSSLLEKNIELKLPVSKKLAARLNGK